MLSSPDTPEQLRVTRLFFPKYATEDECRAYQYDRTKDTWVRLEGELHYAYRWASRHYLRRTFPTEGEREELMILEQNSKLWIFLRRKYVGASEYAALLGMCGYVTAVHYIMFKRGIFGFGQDMKLEFEVGHHGEDDAGAAVEIIVRNGWGFPNFRLGKIGVIVSHTRPEVWASIDTLCEGEGFIPISLLKQWDPQWKCGWVFTEEELKLGGISFARIICELKNQVSPKKFLPEELLQADPAWVIQTQQQLRIIKEQKLASLACREYALIAKLKKPFTDYRRTEKDMGITVVGGGDHTISIWLYKFSPTFWEQAMPRETYWFRNYHDDTLQDFDYPPHLPPPQLPVGIYLGTHTLKEDERDEVIDFHHNAPARTVLRPRDEPEQPKKRQKREEPAKVQAPLPFVPEPVPEPELAPASGSRKRKHSDDLNDKDSIIKTDVRACIICDENVPNRILTCFHAFCGPCLSALVAKGKLLCPICREPVTKISKVHDGH